MGIRTGAVGAGLAVISLLAGGCDDRTRTVDAPVNQQPGPSVGNEVPPDPPPLPPEDSGTPTPNGDGGTPPDTGEPPDAGTPPDTGEPPDAGPWPVDAVLDYTRSFGVGTPQSVGLDEGLN
ncbi:MAG TPA: hypothetical protein VEZ71_00670, partial [Archangium sp.]|nr:hypothetical protein [Archangium sp.]